MIKLYIMFLASDIYHTYRKVAVMKLCLCQIFDL